MTAKKVLKAKLVKGGDKKGKKKTLTNKKAVSGEGSKKPASTGTGSPKIAKPAAPVAPGETTPPVRETPPAGRTIVAGRTQTGAVPVPQEDIPDLTTQSEVNQGESQPPPGVVQGKMIKPPLAEVEENEEVEDIKEQLQNYLEICDSISEGDWEPADLVDVVHVLVRSLNFDCVSLLLIDEDKSSKFGKVINRGFKKVATDDIIALWEECIISQGPTIDWSKLMKIAEDTDSPWAVWNVQEEFSHFGYVPIHDGTKIHGFLVVATYEKKIPSEIASQLLELCGGRIGMSLGLKQGGGKGGDEWPQTVMDTSREIRDQFTLMMGIIELLRDNKDMDAEEISEYTASCEKALTESIHLLDRLTNEAVAEDSSESE